MAQVMGKYLGGIHPRPLAEPFHLLPDLPSGHPPPASGHEHLPGCDPFLSGIIHKLPAKLSGQQDRPHLPLQGNVRPSLPQDLYRHIPHLGHPYACGAHRLQKQRKSGVSAFLRSFQQPSVFRTVQLLFLIPESTALYLQKFHFTIVPAQISQKAVQGREHGIDRGGGIALLRQVCFPSGGAFLVHHR